MKVTIELVHGLPEKELIERIHFHHRQGEVSDRALAFYLLEMQKSGIHRPLKDAAEWAWTHLRRSRADKLVLLARYLEELPEIDAAFAAGEVPWTKVREIARVAMRETERKWLHLARTGTSREVEEAVSRAKRGDEPHRGFKARPPKYLWQLRLLGEEKAVVDKAMRKIGSEMPKGSTPARWLTEMSRRTLSGQAGQAPGKKAASAFLVVLHVGKDGKPWAETDEGRVEIDRAVVEEALREGARAIQVRDVEGAGVSTAIRFGERGKAAPEDRDETVSAELKEAVIARDGGCCVLCRCREDLSPHHLDSHAGGGKSAMHRLVTLCGRCHGAVHAGDIILRVEEDGSVTALDREGKEIGKILSAAEVLADAGEECPLETIAIRGEPSRSEAGAGPPPLASLETLPSELRE
jgi:hypothetical protein